MGRNHLCEQAIPKDPAHLLPGTCVPGRPSGLSLGFPRLSPSRRQLDYVLLARPPRYSPCGFHVRLACLIHAANVRSEPGSNPSLCRSSFNPVSLPQTSPTPTLSHQRSSVQGAAGAAPSGTRQRSHAFFSRPPGMPKIASSTALPCRARGGRR